MILLNWHFNGENHDKPLDLGVPSVTKCCIYLLQLVDLFASATKKLSANHYSHFKSDARDPCEENRVIRLFYQTCPRGLPAGFTGELLREQS